MYIKFVNEFRKRQAGVSNKYGDISEKVVPFTNRIFEVKDAWYHKLRFGSYDEFSDYMSYVRNNFTVVSDFPSDDEISKNGGFEVIIVNTDMPGDDKRNVLVSAGGSLFVMNNEGKTIDRITCFN